ncbi:MAG: CRISPR-associated protein Cas5 [Candidatus Cloacimonetes bacterium]|jgi:CRISPR-associated protein Cas5h|nr:CRISPR-associated protein Cas5 [Candidatus Cloacimonadota bacterium]MDD3563198.1 CRISPR-associated protein Cas5 [Candidatus Cloacimonadota bacterium]
MNDLQSFDTILEVELSGKLAHFRKFYTNASSLTYNIPPRTGICGLVASILKLPRDSYYNTLNSANLGVAIALPPGAEFRKQFFTTNYVGDDKCINNVSQHKQCRLELLMPAVGKELAWIVYLGYKQGCDADLDSLEERIVSQNLGFDVYLGQRQFRAGIRLLNKYSAADMKVVAVSDYVDSVIDKDRVKDIDTSSFRINVERIPLEQALETKGKQSFRKSVRFADVVIETTGMRLTGEFSDLIELENETKTRIAFL